MTWRAGGDHHNCPFKKVPACRQASVLRNLHLGQLHLYVMTGSSPLHDRAMDFQPRPMMELYRWRGCATSRQPGSGADTTWTLFTCKKRDLLSFCSVLPRMHRRSSTDNCACTLLLLLFCSLLLGGPLSRIWCRSARSSKARK